MLSSLLTPISCPALSGDIAAINRTPATHKPVTHPSLLLKASQPIIIIMFPVILLVLKRFPAIEDVAISIPHNVQRSGGGGPLSISNQ